MHRKSHDMLATGFFYFFEKACDKTADIERGHAHRNCQTISTAAYNLVQMNSKSFPFHMSRRHNFFFRPPQGTKATVRQTSEVKWGKHKRFNPKLENFHKIADTSVWEEVLTPLHSSILHIFILSLNVKHPHGICLFLSSFTAYNPRSPEQDQRLTSLSSS